MDMEKCSNCGADNEITDSFCSQCGNKLKKDTVKEKIGNVLQRVPAILKKNKKIVALILVVAVLSGGICCIYDLTHCEWCSNSVADGSDYCYDHKCYLCNDPITHSSDKYCYFHHLTNDEDSPLNTYSAANDLKFSNLYLTSNTSYTQLKGTITNNGTRTYKYVKVKGAFEDYSGNVIDTDWTYAVGSEGLSPGESKTFSMSVTKDYRIKDCTVSIIDYD